MSRHRFFHAPGAGEACGTLRKTCFGGAHQASPQAKITLHVCCLPESGNISEAPIFVCRCRKQKPKTVFTITLSRNIWACIHACIGWFSHQRNPRGGRPLYTTRYCMCCSSHTRSYGHEYYPQQDPFTGERLLQRTLYWLYMEIRLTFV